VNEIAAHYNGMMIALPARQWAFARGLPASAFARLLRDIAGNANVKLLTKARRRPKKKRRTPNCTNVRHLSTKRLLDETR
jgi:hypothetical protein